MVLEKKGGGVGELGEKKKERGNKFNDSDVTQPEEVFAKEPQHKPR